MSDGTDELPEMGPPDTGWAGKMKWRTERERAEAAKREELAGKHAVAAAERELRAHSMGGDAGGHLIRIWEAEDAEKISAELELYGYRPELPGSEDLQVTVLDGNIPVLVHIPHAGLRFPGPETGDEHLLGSARTNREIDLAEEIRSMADYRVDYFLEQFANRAGGSVPYVVKNLHSRLLFDPERFDDATEEMNEVGMGIVYTRTGDQDPLYAPGHEPTDDDVEDRKSRLYRPYAQLLSDTVDRVLERFGHVLIIDLHSYPSRPRVYERLRAQRHGDQARPPLCLGVDPDHHRARIEGVLDALAGEDFTGVNQPFAGAYVPAKHYHRDERVTSVMCEVRKDVYLDQDLRLREFTDEQADWAARPLASGHTMVQVEMAIRRIWLEYNSPGREEKRAARRRRIQEIEQRHRRNRS